MPRRLSATASSMPMGPAPMIPTSARWASICCIIREEVVRRIWLGNLAWKKATAKNAKNAKNAKKENSDWFFLAILALLAHLAVKGIAQVLGSTFRGDAKRTRGASALSGDAPRGSREA